METQLTVLDRNDMTAIDANSLLESFLSGRSERTIEAYRRDLQDFARFIGVGGLDEAVKSFLELPPGHANSVGLKYRTNLAERRLQPTTINRRLAALRSLTSLARTFGQITWKLEVSNLKTVPYRDTRGPGVGGVRAMLKATADRGDEKGLRDLAIVRVLYDLGLRRGELCALDLEDVNLSEHTVLVMGKGRTQRQALTMPVRTVEALKGWLVVRGATPGPLFLNCDRGRKEHTRISGRSVHRIIKDLGERAGIKTRPHGLRHTAISEAVKKTQQAGMGIETVLQFSRHRDIRTAMVYLDHDKNLQGKISDLVSDSI